MTGEPFRLTPSRTLAQAIGSATFDGFRTDGAELNNNQMRRMNDLAATIVELLRAYPGGRVRVTGHADAPGGPDHNRDLGLRRAETVRGTLVSHGVPAAAVTAATEGERAPRVSTLRSDPRNRRVEVQFETGPPAGLAPSLTLTPPAAPQPVRPVDLRYHPRPETAEERLNRILTTPSPSPQPRRSFNDLFWSQVDESVNSAMSRLSVPESLRGYIRQGVRAAIEKGAEAVLDETLNAMNLSDEAKDALRSTARGLMSSPAF